MTDSEDKLFLVLGLQVATAIVIIVFFCLLASCTPAKAPLRGVGQPFPCDVC